MAAWRCLKASASARFRRSELPDASLKIPQQCEFLIKATLPRDGGESQNEQVIDIPHNCVTEIRTNGGWF